MRQSPRMVAVFLLFGCLLSPPRQLAPGREAAGNTDGVLTWALGTIRPGETARQVVLFVFDSSYDDLAARLPEVRAQFRQLPPPGNPTETADRTVWIANEATDFALEAPGSFFWEGGRQSLRSEAGGQLSRLGYYLHYNGVSAGTSITQQGEVENLRVNEPVRLAGFQTMAGAAQTADGLLRVGSRAALGGGGEVGLEFLLTNTSQKPLEDVRLSVYANIEAAHTHEGDYAVLDARTEGFLTVDPATRACVVMAGLGAPEAGYAGTWPSEEELRTGTGMPLSEWKPFEGLSDQQVARLAAVSIPHPIAQHADAHEPETRRLTESEADELLVRDWLFQADDSPTSWRVRQEVEWARELAARIGGQPDAPDLCGELEELDALERRCSAPQEVAARRHRAMPDGLVGYWTFDDISGDRARDGSGNSRDGTLVGKAEAAAGVEGEAVALRRGAFVNVGRDLASLAGSSYTLCAWLKTTSVEADVLGNGVGEGHILLMTYKGVVRGHHWTAESGNVLDGKTTVNDGRWHHVAQVVDADRISLYVDGALDGSQAFVGKRTTSDDALLIGSRSLSEPRPFFSGLLDEVCVFGRPLAPNELRAMLEETGPRIAETDPEARKLYIAVRRVKRRIMLQNPAIDFDTVLFIDSPYPQGAEWPHEARHRNGMMAVPGGRLLVLEGLHPGGRLRKLAPREGPASFWRPDLSFDGKRVLFCMKPADEPSFHLYEVNIDGSGLRQLTESPYDDLDPIYLPDGHIMFSTTRCNTYIRCMPYTYAYVLARCEADGSDIYIISQGNEPDWLPTLLNDGRIIYTRWEYTDKALWRIQSLWTTQGDGTGTVTFWGNQSVWPDMLIEPRPIPGSHRVMFTGAAHHDWFAGSVGIVDPRKGYNFPDGLTKVTADVPWPECGEPPLDPAEAEDYHTSGALTAYKTPYPLSEEDFLVSARTGAVPSGGGAGKFKLYLMDVHGNRELIYEGAHNILHAIPVKPRPRPTPEPDRVAWPGTGDEHGAVAQGVLYSPNVYEGVPGLPRGIVKYLRVIQMDSRTYSTWTRDVMPHQHQGPTVSILQSDGVKRVLGTVPVEADGSAQFEAPPGKALHFQLLDERYRALQTMRSFTGVMPGESRGCIGCHELHSLTPVSRPGGGVVARPARLTPPPWGADVSLGYERMIQPLLDRHCGACHTGDAPGQASFDVTLRPGEGVFKEPYLTIVGGSVYHGERRLDAPPSLAACPPVESWPRAGVPQSAQTFAPMRYLSYASKLVNHYAASGEHYGVQMGERDLRILTAWVDAVCPYRGDEEVRAIADPDFPGIELLPIRPRTATAPLIDRFNIPQDSVAARVAGHHK